MTEGDETTRDKINALNAELQKEKEIEREQEDTERMAFRIRSISRHQVTDKHFDQYMAKIEVWTNRPNYSGFLALAGFLVLTLIVLFQGHLHPAEEVAAESKSAILIVGDAQACLVWCSKRELLVTRVLSDGCECVDSEGEPVKMTWAFSEDRANAGITKVNFDACVGY